MNDIFPELPEPLQMSDLFRAFPDSVRPLFEYHDRLLRDWSPLTVGERELIAAYVSGLNACTYCHGAHTVAAKAFGIDENVFLQLMDDVDQAPVDSRIKPVLAYVKKLTLTPTRITSKDAESVYAAGWDGRALFDAISVCALFNLMNRIVEGSGLRSNPLNESEEYQSAQAQRFSSGYSGEDPHRAPATYTPLLSLWGIADTSGHRSGN